MEPIEIKQRYDALWGIRKTVEQDWDLIEKFITPLRGGKFFQDQSSEHEIDWRRGRDVFDSTAILAANTLASSIHGSLTSPSIRWFDLRFRDDDLNVEDAATEWLQKCSEIMWYALQDSDFNLEVNEAYQDLVCFGNSCIIEEAESEVEWKGIDFTTLPIREVYFEQDHKSQIKHFFRRLEWTALQLVSKFGNKVPERIKEAAKQPGQADKKYVVIYAIYPRKGKEDVDTSKLLTPKQRPYESKYVLHDAAEPIGEEGGYYEMPAYLPRYQKTSGSMWGFGAGTIAISDVMTLNTMVEQRLSAAAKAIDPPSLVTERGLLSDLDLEAGGLTLVRDINGAKPYESGAKFDVAEALIMDLRNNINRMFLVDRLELKESPAMTATEVNARYDLMQRLLGPTFGRLQSDFLSPMLERTFKILMRSGQLPEMPNVLADTPNAELDIEYIGPMGRAQKADMLGAMSQWMRDMAELGELYPELRMLPDAQAYGREMAKAANVPATIVRSQEEVDEMVNQEKQAALQQQQLEQAGMQGQAMQAMGDGAQSLQDAGVEQQ